MEEQDIMREQAQILTDRAYRHQMHGELGDAIALYRRSLAVYPTAEAHTFLGWAYSLMDRYDEAIAWLERATGAPRYATPQFPYLNLGRAYEEMGESYRALACYDRALAIAPLYLPAQWAKGLLLGRLN